MKSLLKKDLFVILLFILIDIFFFWKFFFQELIPIPADVIIGGYYPWLNEKWGYAVGVPVKNALMSDIVSLQYPWRLLAINLVKSGQLPLWDTTSFLGSSLIGNFQSGIFNPFNLLFFLPINFNKAWGLQVVIQPLIAMISMYYLLKNWSLNKSASILGALSYSFSAPLIVWVEYNSLGFALAAFPLLFLTIDKYLKSKKLLPLSVISLIICYVVFSGYPQYIYYFTFFGFIYLSLKSFTKKDLKASILSIFFYVLFIFLGLCLSGVSLLPGIEALSHSIKGLDTAATNNGVLFLPWQNLITGFIPDFLGNPATNNYYGIGYYESLIFYTSLVTLPFALITFSDKNNRFQITILWILILIVFLLALRTPLSELTQNITWLGLKGSVSSRVLFVYAFSLSSLSAIGFNRFLEAPINSEKNYFKFFPFLVVSGALLGLALCFIFLKINLGNLELIIKDYGNIKIAFKNSAIPLALALGVSAIILVGQFAKRKLILSCIIIAIIFFDYFRFSSKYLPFLKSNLIFPKTSSINYLEQREKPFRIAIEQAELLPANTWSIYNLESLTGYNILLPKNTADYISYMNNSHISEGYSRVQNINNLKSPLLDIAGAKYLLVVLRKEAIGNPQGDPPYYLDQNQYKKVFQDGAVAIYENTKSLDRFWSPTNIVTAENSLEAYKIIGSAGFNPKETAVLTENTNIKKLIQCQISNINYTPQIINIQTNCPSEGMLASSQLFYPGWKAKINNQEAEIKKINGIFSGIFLLPGTSQITIYYFPDSFKYGLILSLVSLGILSLISILSWKKTSN